MWSQQFVQIRVLLMSVSLVFSHLVIVTYSTVAGSALLSPLCGTILRLLNFLVAFDRIADLRLHTFNVSSVTVTNRSIDLVVETE